MKKSIERTANWFDELVKESNSAANSEIDWNKIFLFGVVVGGASHDIIKDTTSKLLAKGAKGEFAISC